MSSGKRRSGRRHRRPYIVGDGHQDSPAVVIDGCYRSAQMDRDRSTLYPFDSREAIDLRRSAVKWFEQAQAIERAWLRRTAKADHG